MILSKKQSHKKYLYAFLFLYIIFNLIYLTKFPFMHSDESWLSGLSRNIEETGSFSVTESFFDLKIRHPHAIKIIFHSIQILFIKLLGYELYSMRLISFLFGLFTLYYFYKLCDFIFTSRGLSVILTILLSMDIQFIYASHFARQEIILLFLLIFSLYFILININNHNNRYDLILSIIIGLSIGIHPNSFIISLPFGCIYLYHIIETKKLKIKNLIIYIFTVVLFALVFISLSKYFDPNFISNYMAYGQSEFEVLNPITSKIGQIRYFYMKLFYQVSGTYYTPNIKFQFFLFSGALIYSLIKLLSVKDSFKKESLISIVLSFLAVNGGIILIGRYNQTSIVFIFPLCYIFVGFFMDSLKKKTKILLGTLLFILLSISTIINMTPYLNNSYDQYLYEISKNVPKDAEVLGNLNTEYYFENGKLHDYRNLAFLKDNNMTFQQYIQKNNVQYIIYPDEMDFIYEHRPRWNGVYGNLIYYDDMKTYFDKNCEKIYEFTDSTYGIRIARYVNADNWKIKIYKVIK